MNKLSSTIAALMFAGIIAVSASADTVKRISIITMSNAPELLEVRDGILKGLAGHGYVEGKNVIVDFQSAQGNFGTAQQIVRKFIGQNPDVIVTITTPASQAAIAATKEIPIVFSTVGDPVASKLVTQLKHPGGNASGISDLLPVELLLNVVKQIVPNLKTLGLLYDPSLDNARLTVERVKSVAPSMGFKTLESPAMGLNNVPSAAQNLAGKVEAIFVPNDTTVYAAFEAVVKVSLDTKTPLFTAERRSVQRGAVATVGFDSFQMGMKTSDMVDKVLKGSKPGDIDVQFMKDLPDALGLYLNKASAEKVGVKLSPDLLSKAAHIY